MQQLNTNFEDYRVEQLFDYGSILATMELSKDYHIKKMHQEYRSYLDSSVGEGEAYLDAYKYHKEKADTYRRHINRYLVNEFTNKYSKFKNLEKRVDFSSAPLCEVDWDDLPF